MMPQKYKSPPRPPFDYTGLIKDTLRIVWRHKYLWFFGLFAFGSTTSFGGFNFNYSFDSGSFDEQDRPANGLDQAGNEVADWIGAHVGLIIAALVAIVIVSILIWLWSIVCRGAVIGSVSDIRRGLPSGFRPAFTRGRRSFGRLLLLDLFLLALWVGLAIILAALIALFVFLAVSGDTGETLAIILASVISLGFIGLLLTGLGFLTCFSIWFAIAFLISIILIYATRAAVLEHAGPVEALRRGWRLMAENLTRTLLLYLLSAGLNLAAGIATFLAAGISSIPAIVAWIMTGTGGWPAPGIAISIVLTLIPLSVTLLAVALVNTYFTSFWTIIYLKFSGQEQLAQDPAPFPNAF